MLWLVCPSAAFSASVSWWPPITRTQKPWTYWWWMGSAVDTNNIARELARFHDAGLGGVHIIPIYGARGWESNYIPYLSPRWMEMLSFTVSAAGRLDMGVDMTTGTGWCFGGPQVTAEEANAVPVVKQIEVAAGAVFEQEFDPKKLQALMAFDSAGHKLDLLPQVGADGAIRWQAQNGPWRIYAVSQKPSGQKVKRAAPGDEGYMLNPFYPPAMTNYLRWFDDAFAHYTGPKPRAQYQDSYEYRSSWAPDFFAQFQRRRGYRLQDELPALFGYQDNTNAGRVKSDYRETISDIMVEQTIPAWVQWSHRNGFLVRYEAHGSPGNLLDLYAAGDVPETEMFHLDRDKLFSKFASSAAHVAGHPLASSETGTWLEEHFTETLADMKYLEDDFFLSGINHVFYHGACYSPDEAGWPGWHFYASFEMNPRNPIWRDVPPLNTWAARCQSLLQAGRPDNDILLYWPIYDLWSAPNGMEREFPVHARGWFDDQPVGRTAQWLWQRGYQFDYVSDRQLAALSGRYRTVVVPRCESMPVATLSNLVALSHSGVTVIFDQQMPGDVPGLADLEHRRAELKSLREQGVGKFLVGDLEAELKAAQAPREKMADHDGIMCVRRVDEKGHIYFVANQGKQPFDSWLELAAAAESVVILDPLTGMTGVGRLRADPVGARSVRLQLAAGQSLLLRALNSHVTDAPLWTYWKTAGSPVELNGPWGLQFISGGPELPNALTIPRAGSWTELADTNAQRFSGTARYTIRFSAPGTNAHWRLDLGKVCQSARVRLNGRDLGTLFTPPFCATVDDLQPADNSLEIEVTSVAANRIRDLDQRHVKWKNFRDINFVNIDYKPFDASNWPLTESGFLGPVTLTPIAAETPE
ncbi:MAG TPA: glycosyl hydrolase [Candidatus Saccharimonadales bacterium]|nr:glycosyl hydrolase [Candidatus Saccharimonadales bacterium]